MNPLRPQRPRRPSRTASPELASAARAKRARDHLARKRERERVRLERERQRQQIRRGRLRTLTILSPLLFLGAIFAGTKLAQPVAEALWLRGKPLRTVAVQGAVALSPQIVAAGAGGLVGRSLDAIDPDSVERAVLANPWVESARALRLPTGTLVVRVAERRAIARWHPDEAASIDLVDERGDRFAGALEPGGPLPLVRGEADVTGALPVEALEILDALKRHAALAGDPSALTLHLPGLVRREDGALSGSASGYVLQLGAAGPRALLGRRFFSQRVARLAALLEEDAAMVQSAQLIDLRYADRLVLRTEPVSG